MFEWVDLSNKEILEHIYKNSKKFDPELTEKKFLNTIINQWLENYKFETNNKCFKKNNVKLKNNLKKIIKESGKTQIEISNQIGINRSYISQLIKGTYDPSITLVLLLLKAINYPTYKIENVFWLEHDKTME